MLESAIIRESYSTRGGGVEIDLNKFGYPKGTKMTAYQNYLGGGMLGNVGSDCNISDWEKDENLIEISNELKEYYADQMGFELSEVENLPLSAY